MEPMQTWEDFSNKYRDAIGSIARSNGIGDNNEADLGVARAMLISMADRPSYETYEGVPDDLDFDNVRADLERVREYQRTLAEHQTNN